MVTQTELINYFSSIDKALHSSTNEKRHIIKALRSDVEDYLTSNFSVRRMSADEAPTCTVNAPGSTIHWRSIGS